jgi:hypothetical protein
MLPSACHAVDLPLTDQLAIVAGCDVLISPHSGFGSLPTNWRSFLASRQM